VVARGLEDRLHQPRRAGLYPRSMEVVRAAREWGALGATVSGAGPSVLVWVRASESAAVAARVRDEVGSWAEVLPLEFEAGGLEVRR
jgi:homoserine kinase